MPKTVTAPSTLSGGAAQMWRSTFLSAFDDTCAKRKDRDACAASIAWAQVKTKYRKGEEGKWVKKAGDPVVGPVSPVPDVEGGQALFGIDDLKGTGTKVQRWKLEFARALANECRNSDHPVECARAKANAAVGNIKERSMAASSGDHQAQLVERRTFTAQQRREMAKKGHAMPDGSFPIATCEDVGNAVGSLGRTDKPRAKVVAHIRKRAKALGCRLTPAIAEKMAAIEHYLERSDQRAAANAVDFEHVATLGEAPITRPDHYSSQDWRSLPESHRTVRGEALRRIIERNYAQGVEDAEMSGWKPGRSRYAPEEFYFTKQWPTGDPRAPKVVVRSILVRKADSLDWHLRPISSFASGTLAEKMPAGVVRHIRKYMTAKPLIDR